MKRVLCILLSLGSCLLLVGCDVLPYPRELEETMLVRVLGVDWTESGILLTAADVPEEGQQPRLLTADGTTPEESHQNLKQAGEEYVALTHVTQIVVGAGSDLRAVLEGALKGREVGQTATVWLAADGTARSLLEAAGGGARRLTSLELNAAELEKRTVVDALAELERKGEVSLPALLVEKDKLEPAGMKVWRENAGGHFL